MSDIKSLEVMVAVREEQLKDAQENLRHASSRQRIKCEKCEKFTSVGDIEVIASYRTEEDTGCPAGPDRTILIGRHYVCPKCHWPNKKNQRFNEIVRKHIDGFKGVADEHY